MLLNIQKHTTYKNGRKNWDDKVRILEDLYKNMINPGFSLIANFQACCYKCNVQCPKI